MGPVPVRSRIVFLDWLRGLAAIVMLQGHAFDSFLRPELRTQPAFIFSQFFGGQAAAIFLFLTGITFGLGMNRRDELPAWERITGALRRARYLFLLAIAFRLQMWAFAGPHQPWTDLLHVDVLNLMGDGGGMHPAEGHVGVGYLEHVAPLDPEGPLPHLRGRHPRGPGCGDQGAHARPDDQIGSEPALLERPEHADVGQPLEAAAAQNQGELRRLFHRLPRRMTSV